MSALFREAFGGDGDVTVTKASGRVNLIGEHTDYNDGYVMPVPLDMHVWLAGRLSEDDLVRVYAADYGEWAVFDLKAMEYDLEHLWANYPQGVAWALSDNGHRLRGADIVVSGDVPIGAGLSSSAALEVASVRMFEELSGLQLDPVEVAYTGKRAENDFVGVQSGIMDQFVASLGVPGNALFIDCRTDEYRCIPLPSEIRVIVVDTTVKRELASSAYNERRAQCEEGVSILGAHISGVSALRDVSMGDLRRLGHLLPDVILRRCRHVIEENARVLDAVKALEAGDAKRLGELIDASHESLRTDYEVSSDELDALVDAAREIPGTLGARMTGAGFGGCTVNLVKEENVAYFSDRIKENYMRSTGLKATVYRV
jgi:galactokinase